ncbi:hypothetical protein [Actinophytocola sp.]|uniref:hypothetical protein n=1 Tax=Actinophytocola sp. TaxID=1872138 RepID=UPI003D6B1ADF
MTLEVSVTGEPHGVPRYQYPSAEARERGTFGEGSRTPAPVDDRRPGAVHGPDDDTWSAWAMGGAAAGAVAALAAVAVRRSRTRTGR